MLLEQQLSIRNKKKPNAGLIRLLATIFKINAVSNFSNIICLNWFSLINSIKNHLIWTTVYIHAVIFYRTGCQWSLVGGATLYGSGHCSDHSSRQDIIPRTSWAILHPWGSPSSIQLLQEARDQEECSASQGGDCWHPTAVYST